MSKLRMLTFLLGLVLIISCSKKGKLNLCNKSIDILLQDSIIVFGGYSYMCSTNCFRPIIIDIRNNQLYKSCVSIKYSDSLEKIRVYPINSKELDTLIINTIRIVNFDRLKSFPERIGEPDHRDQGGIHVQVNIRSEKYRLQVDPDSIPTVLTTLISELSNVYIRATNIH
ncbi:MAG: hypothetical protein ACI81T_003844 [Bacteroidia bacterium]|jgi:hypothetical protein